ncbi:MAG: transcriptional regulator, partial [Lacticaseibacillus paracasei]|nr:transcriptional regulator [Lacticaseibacillus paracasei]
FSQGLVSRYVARLVQLNLLTKLSLPDNRKAYIVALTPLGQQVAALHQQMHHHTNAQLASVLHTLDPQDVQTTIQVLTKLTAQPLHPKS